MLDFMDKFIFFHTKEILFGTVITGIKNIFPKNIGRLKDLTAPTAPYQINS